MNKLHKVCRLALAVGLATLLCSCSPSSIPAVSTPSDSVSSSTSPNTSIPSGPAPVNPTPAEPVPVEPAPAEPTPTEPTPAEPAPEEPTAVESTPEKPILSTTPDGSMYVLMYHHFVESGTNLNAWTLTADRFRADMQWLKDNGYTTVLPRELINGTPLPEKPVLVTLDDGYASNYHLMFPILQELECKAVIALITQRIESENPEYLTWDMCREMTQSGLVEFGSHTHDSHSGEKPGILRRDNEKQADYEARIFTDLQTSVDLIEANIGTEVTYFAHPHGQKDKWAEEFVKELFPVTTTSEIAVANLSKGTQDLPRYNIPMDHPLSYYIQ